MLCMMLEQWTETLLSHSESTRSAYASMKAFGHFNKLEIPCEYVCDLRGCMHFINPFVYGNKVKNIWQTEILHTQK